MFLYGVEVRFYGDLLFKFYFGTFQTKFFGHFKRDLINSDEFGAMAKVVNDNIKIIENRTLEDKRLIDDVFVAERMSFTNG